MQIIETKFVGKEVQYKFPRSKKKRVNKKFAKKYYKFEPDYEHVYMIGNHTIIAQPETAERIRAELLKDNVNECIKSNFIPPMWTPFKFDWNAI